MEDVASWRSLGASVTSSGPRIRDGRRLHIVVKLHIVVNWSWNPRSLAIPTAVTDALSDERSSAALAMGPWDVRLLVEDAP